MSKDKESGYYDAGNVEVLDVIKAKLTPEQYEGYLLGNAIKYNLRLNFKGSKERDAEKAKNYSKWFSEFISSSKVGNYRYVTEPVRQGSLGNVWNGITDREFKRDRQ